MEPTSVQRGRGLGSHPGSQHLSGDPSCVGGHLSSDGLSGTPQPLAPEGRQQGQWHLTVLALPETTAPACCEYLRPAPHLTRWARGVAAGGQGLVGDLAAFSWSGPLFGPQVRVVLLSLLDFSVAFPSFL